MAVEPSGATSKRAPDQDAEGLPADEVRGSAEDEIRSLVGMHDVLWPQSARWVEVVAAFARSVGLAGYGLLITPVIEDARLFHRGIGEVSEVVGKEMYEFPDRGGRALALRPEGTAPVVRAFVQHHPPVPWKIWYLTPAFRYERPQAGRYRQHHQLGVEAIGTSDPDLDVEVIALASDFYASLGLRQVSLRVNSMGCASDRPVYESALVEFLEKRRDSLCDEHRDRFRLNPLRVLDCKKEECRAVTKDAPRILDYLDESCKAHFARVREGLDAVGIDYSVDQRLVRGLDYYTRTTFEFSSQALDSAQDAIGGGGRYDGLAEAIGGDSAPGIGFGIGIERLLLACDAEGRLPTVEPAAQVFVVDATGGAAARDICIELRRAGIGAVRAFDDRSFKAQMRVADRSGARFAVIVGQKELQAGEVSLRDLRREDAAATSDDSRLEADKASGDDQETVRRADLVRTLASRFAEGKTR